MKRRSMMVMTAGAVATLGVGTAHVGAQTPTPSDAYKMQFRRVATQYIAALGDPGARAGGGAQTWGLWAVDPGPRGVMLNDYETLRKNAGIASSGWTFDPRDWWLEEHGLIMEQPTFPLKPDTYLVTGGRSVRTALTIHPVDKTGNTRWELGDNATLHDVTHLGCRSARYTPAAGNSICVPTKVNRSAFPVAPGGAMPPVADCNKQEYSVLIVIGVANAT